MELIGEFVTWSAVAFAERIAALDHEAVDNPMKDDAVVVGLATLLIGARVGPLLAAFGEPDEIRDRIRHLFVEEADGEVAFARDEICVNSHPQRISPRRDTIFSCHPTLAPAIPSTVERRPVPSTQPMIS